MKKQDFYFDLPEELIAQDRWQTVLLPDFLYWIKKVVLQSI